MSLRRSGELQPYAPSQQPILRIYKYEFNVDQAKNDLLVHVVEMFVECLQSRENADNLFKSIKRFVEPALNKSRIKKGKSTGTEDNLHKISEDCVRLFKKYVDGGL